MSRPEVDSRDVVQLVVHGAMYPRLADWLEEQGFELQYHETFQDDEPDALKTIMVVPGPALMRLAGAIDDLR